MKNKTKKKWAKYFTGDKALIIMCLPAIIKIFIFSYLTMVGIVIAFQDYKPAKGLFGSAWNGLKNFEFFFKSDSAWTVLRIL